MFAFVFAGLFFPGCNSSCPEGTNEQADGSCISECPDGYVVQEDGQSCIEGCAQDLRLVGSFKMADATLQIDEDLGSGRTTRPRELSPCRTLPSRDTGL